jgi:hypothetical protein
VTTRRGREVLIATRDGHSPSLPPAIPPSRHPTLSRGGRAEWCSSLAGETTRHIDASSSARELGFSSPQPPEPAGPTAKSKGSMCCSRGARTPPAIPTYEGCLALAHRTRVAPQPNLHSFAEKTSAESFLRAGLTRAQLFTSRSRPPFHFPTFFLLLVFFLLSVPYRFFPSSRHPSAALFTLAFDIRGPITEDLPIARARAPTYLLVISHFIRSRCLAIAYHISPPHHHHHHHHHHHTRSPFLNILSALFTTLFFLLAFLSWRTQSIIIGDIAIFRPHSPSQLADILIMMTIRAFHDTYTSFENYMRTN